ncbi:hypothetical protein AB0B07_33080 [Streptomyces sioyaensis]|uniref:hypothetical protein n=1 Tax=Streptomyces sioyaensis TaxID=67364 RepID=UPI00340541E1
MATAAVPAAVPEPNDPPNTTPGSPSSGLFTSMLAAVDPARPATFDIPAPAATEGDTDAPVAGASSAAYHGSSDGSDATQNSGRTVEKKGIWRAWLLAGAARWAKGGGAHNKRLDMEKAKAARLSKEDRKVSINRSEGLPGKGNAGAGGNSGAAKGNGAAKTPNKAPEKGPIKVAPKEQPKGPRNTNGSAHQGPAGRSGGSGGPASGGSGRGPAGGAAGRRGSGTAPKNGKTDGGRDQKQKADKSKVDLSKDKGRAGGSAAGGKDGARGPAGGTGKSGNTTNGGGTKGTGPAADTGKKSKVDLVKDRAGGKDTKRSGKDSGSSKDSAAKPGKPGSDAAAPGKGNGPVSLTKDRKSKDDKSKDDKSKDDKGKGGKDAKPQTKTEPDKKANGKPFSTKESRETGYRDGTRAAKAVAHAKAYRDGVKDGWTDTTEAAERQKAQLDKAHEERKKAQEAARDKEQDVSGAGTSADHHKPQPIEVKGIDAKNLWLGEGSDRNTISRGEVRSLKHFERRLEDRLTNLRDSVERTKLLKAHAEAQAKKITDKKEAAKSVEGGGKLIARLAKLEEDAKVQVGLADEIHKRSIRSTDACAAVLANAKVRYGAMYQAVVDSDETAPAEMSFYLDGATTYA